MCLVQEPYKYFYSTSVLVYLISDQGIIVARVSGFDKYFESHPFEKTPPDIHYKHVHTQSSYCIIYAQAEKTREMRERERERENLTPVFFWIKVQKETSR